MWPAIAQFFKRRDYTRLGLPLAALCLFWLARHYYPFFSDDQMITLRYARRFADGLGLTWDDYERVEGYSNFLWVLLCSLPMKLGADGIATSRWLDGIGAAMALVLVGIGPVRGRPNNSRVWYGALFLGSLAPLGVWSIGGLEHGFIAGVLISALLLLDRARYRSSEARPKALVMASIPLAMLALVRADGAVLVAALALGYLASSSLKKATFVDLAQLLAAPLGAWTLLLSFRRYYYGEWVPNTALAKVAFNTARLELGLAHVGSGLSTLMPSLSVLALLLVVSSRRRLARSGPALGVFTLWSLYVGAVGGDIFPGWRQLLPAMVALGFALATLGPGVRTRGVSGLVHLVALAAFSLQLPLQLRDSENQRAKSERWEWEGLSVGPALKAAFERDAPLLAVDAAGALPYWTEFPALDMLGLNDSYLAKHPPPWHGKDGAIGHDLGDPAYILMRRPDLIAFCNAAGGERPCFRATQKLVGMGEYRQKYRAARFLGVGARPSIGTLQVRLDGKLGLRTDASGVTVPGYFLASPKTGAYAELRDGVFATEISRELPGFIDSLPLAAGRYRVTLDAPEPALFSLRCGSRSAGESTTELVVEVLSGDSLAVAIAPVVGKTLVRQLRLERTTSEPTQRCGGPTTVIHGEKLDSLVEGGHWMAPPAVAFDGSGLTIFYQDASLGREIGLVGDGNDELQLVLMNRDEKFGELSVPMVTQPGLRLRALTVPEELRGRSIDAVHVSPTRGDGHYSVSALILR